MKQIIKSPAEVQVIDLVLDPFGGSPNGGNYFYWLSREYAQGRVSQKEYNRQVYGIGK